MARLSIGVRVRVVVRLSVSVLWTFICAGSAAHTGGEVAWEGWVRVMFEVR